MPKTLFLTLLVMIYITASATAAPPRKAKKPVPPRPVAPSLPALPTLPAAPSDAEPATDVPASADDVLLYNGRALADANVSLAGWGGGGAEDSTDVSLLGGHALKVTTIDPYQGATLTFTKPVDLGRPNIDKTRTLVFVLRPATVTRRFVPPSDAPRYAPSPGGGQDDTPPVNNDTLPVNDAAPVNDNPGSDHSGVGDNSGGGDVSQAALPNRFVHLAAWGGKMRPRRFAQYGQSFSSLSSLRMLHIVLQFAGGKTTDVVRPFPVPAGGDTDQWVTMGVPLPALHAPGGPASLQSVSIAGSDFGAFYIGQIKLVHDTALITCFAGDDQTVRADTPLTLTGTAGGGLSTLRYAWNFGTGTAASGEGRTVTTQYTKSGDYTATLTVSDMDGLKSPATATTVIHVR